jgi:hypothetical protein
VRNAPRERPSTYGTAAERARRFWRGACRVPALLFGDCGSRLGSSTTTRVRAGRWLPRWPSGRVAIRHRTPQASGRPSRGRIPSAGSDGLTSTAWPPRGRCVARGGPCPRHAVLRGGRRPHAVAPGAFAPVRRARPSRAHARTMRDAPCAEGRASHPPLPTWTSAAEHPAACSTDGTSLSPAAAPRRIQHCPDGAAPAPVCPSSPDPSPSSAAASTFDRPARVSPERAVAAASDQLPAPSSRDAIAWTPCHRACPGPVEQTRRTEGAGRRRC